MLGTHDHTIKNTATSLRKYLISISPIILLLFFVVLFMHNCCIALL